MSDILDRIIAVNLTGTFLCVQAAMPSAHCARNTRPASLR